MFVSVGNSNKSSISQLTFKFGAVFVQPNNFCAATWVLVGLHQSARPVGWYSNYYATWKPQERFTFDAKWKRFRRSWPTGSTSHKNGTEQNRYAVKSLSFTALYPTFSAKVALKTDVWLAVRFHLPKVLCTFLRSSDIFQPQVKKVLAKNRLIERPLHKNRIRTKLLNAQASIYYHFGSPEFLKLKSGSLMQQIKSKRSFKFEYSVWFLPNNG